jgi:hypothetical protein
MVAYESFSKYLIGFIPNMLSYAFVYNQWSAAAQNYTVYNDNVGLTYLYCHITRLLFFYNNEHGDLVDPILMTRSLGQQSQYQRVNFFEGIEFYIQVIELATSDLLESWKLPLY